MNRLGVALLCVALWALGGCGPREESRQDETPQVYTTFYPSTYFTERIAGPHVRVVCPLPPDADPIFWMPDSDTIAAYQQADLIVAGGAELEKWMQQVTLPQSKLVRTAAPFRHRWIKHEGVITHSHGPAGEHSHEGIDPHTWLDPNNARMQAAEIRDALVNLVPKHAETFQSNYTSLAADFDQLDAQLQEVSKKLDGQTLLASHPAYSYLAERYGWNVVNLHLDPETTPNEEELAEIREKASDSKARILLWESPPREEVGNRLASELAVTNVVFSPCETPADSQADGAGDYLERMRQNIARLKDAVVY